MSFCAEEVKNVIFIFRIAANVWARHYMRNLIFFVSFFIYIELVGRFVFILYPKLRLF